ncbi:MAG: GTPase domain-containing protein [Deltaproteobacteria bacterium]|nr:GTPase domain-containing protein [Deltaproteobacteria bacterium]
MAKMNSDETAVNARILYWGIDGAGKTANLQSIHRKLRADHRGEIQREATLIDPAVEYESLAIELGEVGGLKTRIQMIAVPGSVDQAPTRKQLLDQVDGIVMVVDSREERIEENASSLSELSEMLLDYGRQLEDVPLVLQYNKRDLSDPYVIEVLHRKLGMNGVAVFEAVATENSGVLQTLSTLSKHVIRSLRGQQFSAQAEATPEPGDSLSDLQAQPEPIQADEIEPVTELMQTAYPEETAPEVSAATRMEDAILSEEEHPEANALDDLAASAQTALEIPWGELEDEGEPSTAVQLNSEFSIASVGEATRSGERGVRIPLVVSDKSGRTSNLVLTIQLDPEADGENG